MFVIYKGLTVLATESIQDLFPYFDILRVPRLALLAVWMEIVS